MGLIVTIAVLAWAGEAKDRRDVASAFETYRALAASFDPALAECFASDATLTAVRGGQELRMTGAQARAAVPKALAVAKIRGDIDKYTDVALRPGDAGRWVVTATRTSTNRCTPDPGYAVEFAKIGRRWLVVSERSEVPTRSACPPDPELPTRLDAVRAQLQPGLPMKLDEETLLDGVLVDGTALTYAFLLPHVPATELPKLEGPLREVVLQNVCHDVVTEDLVNDGATVWYRYRTVTGEALAYAVRNGDCP